MLRRLAVVAVASFVVGGLAAAGRVQTRSAPGDVAAPAPSLAPPSAAAAEPTARATATTSPSAEPAPRDDEPAPAAAEPEVVPVAPVPPGPVSEVLAPRVSDDAKKVHRDLAALADAVERSQNDPTAEGPPTHHGDRYIPVSAVAQGSSAVLLKDLRALGLAGGLANATTVSGRLPIEQVGNAKLLESLRYMRPEWMLPSTGTVEGQGDKSLRADIAREKYGVTGKGVTVGLLSDSFDCLGTAAEDVASGDIPEQVKVVKEGECSISADEGRAMAQIVSDIAPDASMMFRTAAGGQMEIRNGINSLVRAGADVIVDDIGYVAEPWFQDGLSAQAVDAAWKAGVSYFSAAGNDGRMSYEAPFDDMVIEGLPPKMRLHDFKPGGDEDPFQRVTIAPGTFALLELQWSDNFKTHAPKGPAPKTDLDFVALVDGFVVAVSNIPNRKSLEPVEVLPIVNSTAAPISVDLAVVRVEGPNPTYMKWIAHQSDVKINEYRSKSEATSFGHAQAAGAITVGAANFRLTPPYGVSPAVLRKYSSSGGVPILIDTQGRELGTAFKRRKPEVVAPDGVNTTFFGFDTSDDRDQLPNFLGTSAAAPHAAAVAALLLENTPDARPVDVCNAMAATGVGMGPKGFDFDSGYGLVDAHDALKWLTATGRKGPCTLAPVELTIDTPDPEPDPVIVPAPARPTAPQPVRPPAAPAPPPKPTPTPIPVYPHLFTDETQVAAGDELHVEGWYLPRQTTFEISFDGERSLGTATSDAKGSLSASLKVPAEVKQGSYKVVGRAGERRVSAARQVVVFQRQLSREGPAPAPIAPVSASPVLDGRTIFVLVVLAMAVIGVRVLRGRRRRTV